MARGGNGHAAAAAALELAAEVAWSGRRRLLTLAAADAQLAGERQRAGELLRRAAETGESLPAPLVGMALVAARKAMAQGRHRAAERGLAGVAAGMWQSGAIRRLPTVLALRSWALARAGDLGAAESEADRAVTLAALTGDQGATVQAGHTRTLITVLRGGPAPASGGDPLGAGLALLGALAGRDPAEAVEVAAEHLPDLLECRLIRDRALSRDDLSTLHGLTRSTAGPIAANAWRVLGLTSRDSADDCFAQATRLHRAMDLPFDNARVHLSYGERLRRDGDRRAARNQLRIARDTFADLRATPWVARAERELKGTDESRVPAGLTPAEFEVARIVATGVSTRETAARLFLSPKTVEFHLSKVFRKLGVSSRAQLAHVFPELSCP
ncbi:MULTISPECIES: helix-turn-helix transcriptional regulator [unclassified Actinoplanes]|uniref:helix-turn-helix transcriptional regulator n=1 Tax=unclassified Actinoplanes TaxID=2626549 RepID=UPI0002FB8EAB|nr:MULTISPECIES: helix-turn-helix transcriptional regulator [unclassified Actinoplanes]